MSEITETMIPTVEKEEIVNFIFPKEEVLGAEAKKEERDSRIKKAMRLGNSSKGKVKIIFEDMEGLKKVETTIWGVTENNILLKKTTLIPIRCIHEIKFY